jgi:hypothetical protein
MQKILAITTLMFGLAGGAMAQNPSSPQTADRQQSTAHETTQTGAVQKSHCKADARSSANQQGTCPECKSAQNIQAPDQAAQNVIEYRA